jgi:hypothetical protein
MVPCGLKLGQGLTSHTKCLIDTDALQANYISEEIADELERHGISRVDNDCVVIYGGLNQPPIKSQGRYKICLVFDDETTKKPFIVEAHFHRACITFPIIIGRHTMKKFDMVQHLPSQFFSKQDKSGYITWTNMGVDLWGKPDQPARPNTIDPTTTILAPMKVLPPALFPWETVLRYSGSNEIESVERHYVNAVCSTKELSPEGNLSIKNLHKGKKEVLEDLPDPMDPKMNIDPWDAPEGSKIEVDVLPGNIHGPEKLKESIRQQLIKFGSIFSRQIRPIPAKLPAFELEVDETKWEQGRTNKGSPRLQSDMKDKELRRRIEKL